MSRQVIIDPSFGRRLKELREQRGLSLRRLGQQVFCSHGYLWDLEAGTKRPSSSVAASLDAALGAAGTLSALLSDVSADAGEPDVGAAVAAGDTRIGLEFASDWRDGVHVVAELWRSDMHRRDLLCGSAFGAAAFLTPALRWLTVRLDEDLTGDGEHLVGEPDIETLRQITSVYRKLDNRYGGGHIRDGLVRFLDSEVSVLLKGRFDSRTGRALCSAAAEATHLLGWASYDVGLNSSAQRYMVQALRLAAAANDRPLGAEILAAMSHQAAYLGASSEAVDLARAAGRTAAEAGVAALQAEAAVLEAQGHAVGGDERPCTAALGRAERAFDRADYGSAPQWIGYFDEAYLSAKFGHCFASLGRGELAARFAVRSLKMDGDSYVRGRQFNLVLLAVAHAQSGDPEQAAVVGVRAIEATEGLRSRRARDYLGGLAGRLAPHTSLPTVGEFTTRVRPVLQAVEG